MTGRIVVECAPCGFGMDAPDSPLGRAMRDEFDKEHAAHQEEGDECYACSGSGVIEDGADVVECQNCNGTGEVR